MANDVNDLLVLICGMPSAGKSASLQKLGGDNPESVWYFNTEAGKKLPFRSKFKEYKITKPDQIKKGMLKAEEDANCKTIVIDSLTFLLEMFISQNVYKASDTFKGWNDFQEWFKDLMQNHVAKSTKRIIFTAHIEQVLNEGRGIYEYKVPVKGALGKNGIEAYFSCIVYAKRVDMEHLEGQDSDLLHVTPKDERLGYKHCFQTQIIAEDIGERIRGPMGLFDDEKEIFMDNDAELLLQRLADYYA